MTDRTLTTAQSNLRRNDRSNSQLPPILPPRSDQYSGTNTLKSEDLSSLPPGYGDTGKLPYLEDELDNESLGSDEEYSWDDFEEVSTDLSLTNQ